jgi:hypothetical protein
MMTPPRSNILPFMVSSESLIVQSQVLRSVTLLVTANKISITFQSVFYLADKCNPMPF